MVNDGPVGLVAEVVGCTARVHDAYACLEFLRRAISSLPLSFLLHYHQRVSTVGHIMSSPDGQYALFTFPLSICTTTLHRKLIPPRRRRKIREKAGSTEGWKLRRQLVAVYNFFWLARRRYGMLDTPKLPACFQVRFVRYDILIFGCDGSTWHCDVSRVYGWQWRGIETHHVTALVRKD